MAGEELRREMEKLFALDEISMAPQRKALLNVLWSRRKDYSTPERLWEDAVWPTSREKKKADKESKGKEIGTPECNEETVRQACRDLRKRLREYSEKAGSGWHFDLPDAIQGKGWQLQLVQKNSQNLSAAQRFWQAHLNSRYRIYVVYVEQLFFNNWSERLVFRYYDCNEERSQAALEGLENRHPEIYKLHKGKLSPAFPYVAWGEVEARDLIRNWFSEHALVRVQTIIPRREPEDTPLWDNSLILFGTALANSMINEVLGKYPDLAIRMEEGAPIDGRWYGRVAVKAPTDQEKQLMLQTDDLSPIFSGSDCTLDFSADKGTVLVIITRVRNPYNEAVVTIINADFGRAVEQMAALLTDERRMSSGEELPTPLPEYFQALFAIPVHSLNTQRRRVKLTLLAFRRYTIPKFARLSISLE